MPRTMQTPANGRSLRSQIESACGGDKLLSDLCQFHLIEENLDLRHAIAADGRLATDFTTEIDAVIARLSRTWCLM